MQATPELLDVSDRIVSEVRLLSGIAKANGSLPSLKDVVNLSQFNISEEGLQACWDTIPELAAAYQLKNGLILERTSDHETDATVILKDAIEKRARAEEFSRYAREFASLCNQREAKLIAISGSTSYKAASRSDDLDFFCITKPNTLWVFLTRSLLLARFSQVFKSNKPRICLSYMVDENFAQKEFLAAKDCLFARDALTTDVIHGTEFYRALLRKSSWMDNYYPRLYQQVTSKTSQRLEGQESAKTVQCGLFLNLLLLFLVGRYITLKSFVLNRKLRKRRKFSALFTLRVGPDHCIFESCRYAKLKQAYPNVEHPRLPADQELATS